MVARYTTHLEEERIMAVADGSNNKNELMHKLQNNPEIAKLMKDTEAARSQAAQAEGAAGAEKAMKHQQDEQELAPGNPRSLDEIEKVNPRKEGEDPVAYLDRIFG